MSIVHALPKSPLLFFLVLGSAACAKPPNALLTRARQAGEEARTTDAAEFAPEAFAAAEKARAALDAEMAVQQERVFFRRSYDEVRLLAQAYEDAATTASGDAHAAREEAQRLAVTMIQELRQPLEDLRARTSSRAGVVVAAELDDAQGHLDAAETALGEQRYREAQEHAAMAREIIDRVGGAQGASASRPR